MKKSINLVTKNHISIMKMIDYKFSFLINYLLFGQMKKMIETEIKIMKSVDA